jgi:hypothetical protein
VLANARFRVPHELRAVIQKLWPISPCGLRADAVHTVFVNPADRERDARGSRQLDTLLATDVFLFRLRHGEFPSAMVNDGSMKGQMNYSPVTFKKNLWSKLQNRFAVLVH